MEDNLWWKKTFDGRLIMLEELQKNEMVRWLHTDHIMKNYKNGQPCVVARLMNLLKEDSQSCFEFWLFKRLDFWKKNIGTNVQPVESPPPPAGEKVKFPSNRYKLFQKIIFSCQRILEYLFLAHVISISFNDNLPETQEHLEMCEGTKF